MQVFEWVKNHGGEPIIPFSGVFESKLVDMPEDERDKYCKEVCLTAFATHIVLEEVL
jgi:obg-like ATPase 1